MEGMVLMSIAIMACRKVIGKCAASGCFKAYNNSTAAFSIYGENKEDLASFFYCAGCKDTLVEGENWTHKVKQLKKEWRRNNTYISLHRI